MVSSCQQLEQSDWNYVEIKIWIKYSSISKWHNLKGTKHLVMGQKEGYLKREMTIKRKKYILVGTISNSTLTFLPLQLNSLRFLEFRGSLLTILATVSYVTTSCVTTWLHVTHLLHITDQHIRSSLAAFGSPGFERPVSPPSTIALSSATERGLSRSGGAKDKDKFATTTSRIGYL